MERQEYYRRLIAAHEKSGKSVREFCRKRKLSPWTFYSCRKRLAQMNEPACGNVGTGSGPGFVRVAVSKQLSSDTPRGKIEVQLEGETVIRFPEALSCSRIVEITQALRDGLR